MKTNFASHPKSKFWSSRNDGNPEDYALNSHKKFWFDCECGHSFEQDPNHINTLNRWCPYCSNQKLCDKLECLMCYNKSFSRHIKSAYLTDKNLQARSLFLYSNKKYEFNCNKCNHKFETSPNKVALLSRWCPYCSNSKLCEENNCQMCWNNSFASVERSKFLNDKSINPRILFKSTNNKFKFNCDVCNKTFHCQLSAITRGVWCSFCVNKTELILYNNLIEQYSTLKRQYKVDWCKNIKHLPFDFVIEDRKIIIELDGKQHFEQIGKWQSPEENRKNDKFKMNCANNNDFSVIRILQKDVYKDKYDWLTELCDNIEKITNENRVQNIYMCKNNEYKDFDI